MKIKPRSGRWFVLALMIGMVSGLLCQLVGAPGVISQAMPFAVSAAIIHGTRKKWLE